ncbi:hypothetical protein ACF0H5_002389 [Mactra antiquata]
MNRDNQENITYGGSIQAGDIIAAQCDYDAVSISGPITEQRFSHHRAVDTPSGAPYFESSLPNLASSTNSDTLYLIKYEPSKTYRKWLIGLYCFFFMGAYITSYYTFIQYVYSKVQKDFYPDVVSLNISGPCSVNSSTADDEKQTKIQQKAATWSMYYNMAAGIPAVFSNVLLGSSTDKFGRKFLFFLPCIGTFIRMALSVAGIYFNFDLKFHLIGYVIEGSTGQMFTMLVVCFTYVADITQGNGKMRSFGITLVELSIGMALSAFSFTTGYFIQSYGFFLPMLSSGILIAMSTCVVFFIPESFPKSKRNTSESIFIKIKTAYDLFLGSFNRGRRWKYNILMLVFAVTIFGAFGRYSVEPIYQLGAPFCMSSTKIGYFATLRNLVQQAVGMSMIRVLQMFLSDETIGMIGCVSFAGGMLTEGLAKTETMLYIVPVVGAFGMLTVPIVRSLLSKLTRSDQQGAVFAAIAAVETSLNVGGGVAATAIYNHTVGVQRGFVFFVFAACNIVGFLLMGIFKHFSRRSTQTLLEIR